MAVLLRAFSASELHLLLTKDENLRTELGFQKVPHRKPIARRISALTKTGEQQIAAFGFKILTTFAVPNQEVSAIDGRMYQALGPLWHKKYRHQNLIPAKLRNVDTESEWFKSGYRGWVQGYRLVLQGLVFPLPVPLFATWRCNNQGESTIVKEALKQKKMPLRIICAAFILLSIPAATRTATSRGLTPYLLNMTIRQLENSTGHWTNALSNLQFGLRQNEAFTLIGYFKITARKKSGAICKND